MKTRLFLTVAVFLAFTAIASAQTNQQSSNNSGKGSKAGSAWVDANNNGVCDNYENGTRMGRQANSNGQNANAVNRGSGKGNGQGMHNGRGKGNCRAQGTSTGKGRNNGKGPAYTDANNDGVCDNLQSKK